MKTVRAYAFTAALLISVASAFAQSDSKMPATNTSSLHLKIQLPDTWTEIKQPGAGATFHKLKSGNLLQISWAEYRGKQPLRKVTPEELKDTATKFGQKNTFGELTESSSGECKFGIFGTAIFHSAEHPNIQVWFITDGTDHILATYICSKIPDPVEIQETSVIVKTATLSREN